MKTMKTNFNTIASKGADMGKHLTIFSIIFGTLFVSAQSRIGSGDQGVQGLLAATTRQIVPGSEVVIDVPSVSLTNAKVLVTSDVRVNPVMQGTKYCVSILDDKSQIGLDDVHLNTKCHDVGRPLYVRGSARLLIYFNSSVAIYNKKENEDLIIKLSKVRIPNKKEFNSATLYHDFASREEANKILYAFWMKFGADSCLQFLGSNSARYKECKVGGFESFKQAVAPLESSNEQISNQLESVNFSIGRCLYGNCDIYALPGTYKIRWRFDNYDLPLETTGIILK